jgi:glycosyltransferase involved in cell wall biosynthesis
MSVLPSDLASGYALDGSLAESETRSRAAVAPVRLLKFLAYLAIGGTERQILNIKAGIDPSRFQVHLGCFGYFKDQVAMDLSGSPLEIYPIKKLYGIKAMQQALRLSAYLRRQRIDIVHAYNFYANVFAVPAARLAGVPVVLASNRDTGQYWTARQRRVNKLVCRMAHGVVVNAEAIKKGLIEEGYPPERIIVIHNGIICPSLKTAAAKKAIKRKLNVPVEAPLIGVVARLDRLKGIEYFVEAAKAVLSRVPDARFLIVGDTSVYAAYRDELKQRVTRLGLDDRLRFTGFRLDIPDVLSALTVSVLPSIAGEGLSNSLLESMAAGVPVVATNIGGNPEVVVDGETGLLVAPKDAAALASALCRILETPRLAEAMGQAGRQRVLDHFSNERMIERTQQIYDELLEQARRNGRPRKSLP